MASLQRVAALADVHGNAVALEAVLAELEAVAPDLVVFCGDLTWGSLPRETLALVRSLRTPVRFVRGNGDRAVGTLLDGRGEWMAAMHAPDDLAFLMRPPDDPRVEQIVELMLQPASREEAIEHAEKVVFAE